MTASCPSNDAPTAYKNTVLAKRPSSKTDCKRNSNQLSCQETSCQDTNCQEASCQETSCQDISCNARTLSAERHVRAVNMSKSTKQVKVMVVSRAVTTSSCISRL